MQADSPQRIFAGHPNLEQGAQGRQLGWQNLVSVR